MEHIPSLKEPVSFKDRVLGKKKEAATLSEYVFPGTWKALGMALPHAAGIICLTC